jgi:hypothetical protein
VTPDGTGDLMVEIGASTPVGVYPLIVTGATGTLSQYQVVTLTVLAAPDFTLSVAPSSRTISQGESAAYTATLTALNGFAEAVTLDVSGLPAGATADWSTNPATPDAQGADSVLTINTAISTPVGDHVLTLTGTGGGQTHGVQVTLTVDPVLAADFALDAWPATQAITQGHSVSYTVAVTAVHGFDQPVVFDVAGIPNEANIAWTINPVVPTGSTVLTLTTSATTPVGSYPLTVIGTGGGFSHSAGLGLAVVSIHPDLVVESVQADPAMPVEDQETLIFVTVRNHGAATGPFRTDWYVDPVVPPGPGDTGELSWALASLDAGGSIALTGSYTFTQGGDHSLWARVDTLDAVAEADETNNVTGPVTVTVLIAVEQVCGAIVEDTTWHTGTVCEVTCDVAVQSGVRLTVEPGAHVKFNSNTGINVYGTLLARGTAARPILFTANSSTPSRGYWDGIDVFADGQAVIEHAIVSNAGSTSGSYDAAVYNVNGASTLVLRVKLLTRLL